MRKSWIGGIALGLFGSSVLAFLVMILVASARDERAAERKDHEVIQEITHYLDEIDTRIRQQTREAQKPVNHGQRVR